MKKVFPSIVILISLSLLALMFLQFSWIQNAILVQKGKYQNDLEGVFSSIRQGLLNKATQHIGYNPKVVDFENPIVSEALWTKVDDMDIKEISEIIERGLRLHELNFEFEFGIRNGPFFIHNSPGFTQEMTSVSYKKTLNFNNSYDNTYTLFLYIKQPKNLILQRTFWLIITSAIFTLIIISAFYITVRTIFRQKKLSEIKSDFINNMTHEFKTPIATISLAVDAINNHKINSQPQQVLLYNDIIKEENNRMLKQVEKILQAARLEQGDLELFLQPLDAHQIIKRAVQNISLLLMEKQGTITLNLKAKYAVLPLDEVHFSNIIANLLDNGIKYSLSGVKIEVETYNTLSKSLVIKIKDNGIGMTKDTSKRIFDKFYRAHTGNIHNVKGFGLGLSYVKSVIDAHKGKIKVESTLGKGSTFQIELLHNPNKKINNKNNIYIQ